MSGVGRKTMYRNKDELQKKIDEYFVYCEGRELTDEYGKTVADKYGVPIRIETHVPTVTGLARYLGFKSRQALLNYQGRTVFSDTVSEAKMRIEEYAEERLFDRDGVQGAKFTLCNNFGWSEKQSECLNDGEKQEKLLEAIKGAVSNGNS